MSMDNYFKDPGSKLDYSIDWSDWLQEDTLLTAVWTIPDGLTKESEEHTSTFALVWISGGTAGANYTCTCVITTAGGRTDERSIIISVRER